MEWIISPIKRVIHWDVEDVARGVVRFNPKVDAKLGLVYLDQTPLNWNFFVRWKYTCIIENESKQIVNFIAENFSRIFYDETNDNDSVVINSIYNELVADFRNKLIEQVDEEGLSEKFYYEEPILLDDETIDELLSTLRSELL